MRSTGAETKERIEAAAVSVFVQKGVEGASVRDIAEVAGISQGAMYVHFDSKEELAWKLFSRGWAEMGLALRQRAKNHKLLADQIEAMVGYVFDSFDKNWEFVTYVYLSRHQHLRRVTGATTNPYLVFRVVIVEAMTRGEIPRQDPDLATAMVMGVIVQVMDMKILDRIKGKLSHKIEDVAAACVQLLGASPRSNPSTAPA